MISYGLPGLLRPDPRPRGRPHDAATSVRVELVVMKVSAQRMANLVGQQGAALVDPVKGVLAIITCPVHPTHLHSEHHHTAKALPGADALPEVRHVIEDDEDTPAADATDDAPAAHDHSTHDHGGGDS